MTMSEQHPHSTRTVPHRGLIAVGVLVLVVASLVVVPGVAEGAAANDETTTVSTVSVEEKAPYYANHSNESAGVESWMDGREDPTLANVTHYLTRVPSFLVGTGSMSGGSGPVGTVLSGLIVLAAFLGTTIGTPVGPVGGTTVSMIALAGLTSVGMLPEWLFAVALFGVGLVATKVFISIYR